MAVNGTQAQIGIWRERWWEGQHGEIKYVYSWNRNQKSNIDRTIEKLFKL
jgi:hypothetical protein